MRKGTKKTIMTESPQERCDIKVWSGECRQSDSETGGKEYLCPLCGTISGLDHELHHEGFPHVSGDTDNLS
jgi:hypothetical protein